MSQAILETPIGPLFIDASDRGVRLLSFLEGVRHAELLERLPDAPRTPAADAVIAEVEGQIGAYFTGDLRDFDLPLDLKGTPFQTRVWRSIAEVPYGETISYSELAMNADAPNAYRAAGTACGANPCVIIVPCHRIVGRDKGLHGFGGGLSTKVWLLRHEGSISGIKAGGWVNRPPRRLPALV